jgi:hypothetical protein
MITEDAPKVTARLRFRCSASMYKFLYTELPNFFQQIRLRLSAEDGESLDGNISQYRAVSTGKLRNVSFDLDKYYEIETYYFDDNGHRGIEVFQVHDIILVNDRAFLVKELYKAPQNKGANTKKGVLQLFEQEFSTINRFGDPDAIVITDPVLGGDNGDVIGT